MKKFLLLLLALCFMFVSMKCVACEHYTQSPEVEWIPSVVLSDLYDISGDFSLVDDMELSYKAGFSDNIIDYLPVIIWSSERHLTATMYYPEADMDYDFFIIDANYNVLGNAECLYLECTCGEWWYEINITLTPNACGSEQIAYLVWVE